MRTILELKQRNLLIHSEAAKVEDWFYDFIQKHEKITDKLLRTLPREQQIFITEMLPRVLQSASNEWIKDGYDEFPDDDMGDDRVECSLCHKDNKYVYFILNTKNGARLNVGSTCITKFDIINREGLQDSDLFKLSREGKLTQAFPGILRELHDWSTKLERYSVVIPLNYEDQYTSICRSLEELVHAYLSGTRHSSVFREIEPLLESRSALLSTMDEHVEREIANKSHVTATRQITRWLQREQDYARVNWLKEDGRVTLRTAIRICEPNFMRAIFPLLKDVLDPSLNISLSEAKEDTRGYVYTYKNVRFSVPHSDLLPYCGFLTNESSDSLTLEDLVNMSKVVMEDTTVIHVLRALNQVLRGTGWELHEYDFAYNEVFAQNRSKDDVRQLKLVQFVQHFGIHAVTARKDTKTRLLKTIEQGGAFTFKTYTEMKKRREELESGGRRSG